MTTDAVVSRAPEDRKLLSEKRVLIVMPGQGAPERPDTAARFSPPCSTPERPAFWRGVSFA
jgi:hypothetical protein